ncbi:nudC domain-containing protein 3-like isoform X2 [Tachypleus tridentatus]|uniref:nudC domain-containing protein 3-like isoform X2 n=2 Tax=Tachypleus tridentatus TaxID=6853 RepID=UPI003FD45732
MAEERNIYDDALFGILQNEGQIYPFLDVIFGFLYRRTDFYKIQHDENDKMGFPMGMAGKIVQKAFKKYCDIAMENDAQQLKKNQVLKESEIPLPVATVEVVTSEQGEDKLRETNAAKSHRGKVIQTSEKKNIELTQTDFQKNAESYNGAIRNNYSWAQTIKDLDVRVKVPQNVILGKSVKVDIKPNSLTVRVLNEEGWTTELDGELSFRINVEDSVWTLFPGEHVHVNLEKVQERFWESLMKDEPKIDLKEIDNSQPMEDLDEETQAKVNELLYNERQKQLGLPTSEQKKMENILKEAWDKEGSPFRGQPFDPSTVNISNPGDLFKT